MQKKTKDYYLEAINRAIEFIESNASRKVSLAEVAEFSFLSKFHFHRIFKAIVGDTTKEYLTRLRLEKSVLLLKHTEKTISEIAYACGYTSPETYTRAFKSYFSTSPTLYRTSLKASLTNKRCIYEGKSFDQLSLSSPKIVDLPDLNLAYIRHFGGYDKVGKSFQKLMLWASKHFILKLRPATLGIVHDNPDLTEEPNIRFDACVLVTKKVQPTGAIGFKSVKGGKFAVFRYRGPYESFYPVYDYIYNICLFEQQWGLRDEPALEWYIKSPPFYKPHDLVTDFYLPIE